MNFNDYVAVIQAQWAVIVGVAIFVVPFCWIAVRWFYENRLEELKAENRRLTSATTSRPPGTPDSLRAPPTPSGVSPAIFAKTSPESEADLITRLRGAKKRINVFGLTRNYFVSEVIRPILVAKAQEIPVILYLMDPNCDSRRDRYRLEPLEAALQEPERMRDQILSRWDVTLRQTPSTDSGSNHPGLSVYFFNFPCSFAIEEIDDVYRVMLYGHGKRGTEGPIILFNRDESVGGFLSDQMRWLERLAGPNPLPPWTTTNRLRVWKYLPTDRLTSE